MFSHLSGALRGFGMWKMTINNNGIWKWKPLGSFLCLTVSTLE